MGSNPDSILPIVKILTPWIPGSKIIVLRLHNSASKITLWIKPSRGEIQEEHIPVFYRLPEFIN